ncbi:hypothetical protein PCANC_20777 [Puccinia coronata f. sp. avenae]|uniref:CCHC-type domain-containing protein n=1 Tax=Puccinia coronata f. sp. avenae TaxID=200324 RepID=A0A2N5TRG4_9BASI|nr:hypothetical protein PCANC_20777 [Puccinia coronata f. sp. avenae]
MHGALEMKRSAREAEPQCADRSVQRPGGAPRCAPSASRNHGIRLFLASQYTFKYIIFPSSTTFTAGSHEFGRRLIVIHPELSHIAFHRPAFLIAIPCSLASWNPSSNLISQMNQIVSRQRSARDCSHQLCLTCGAIDEHITRQCPVSLVCHSCGSRGHLSRHCPSSSRRSGVHCARCDSTIHLTLNCPSIWRSYDEEPNDAPKRVLRACYYCGDTGDHFGDQCPFRRSTLNTEPSAFSDRSALKRDSHPSRHHESREPSRHFSPRHQEHERHHNRGREDLHRSLDPPPSRKMTTRPGPGRRDIPPQARHIVVEDEDDWFSQRHRRDNPKRSGPPTAPSGSKSSRIGGSYKGGYIK